MYFLMDNNRPNYYSMQSPLDTLRRLKQPLFQSIHIYNISEIDPLQLFNQGEKHFRQKVRDEIKDCPELLLAIEMQTGLKNREPLQVRTPRILLFYHNLYSLRLTNLHGTELCRDRAPLHHRDGSHARDILQDLGLPWTG